MTYRNCKKLIEMKKTKKELTEAYVEEMAAKLDIFLLNDRINQTEYEELMGLMEA